MPDGLNVTPSGPLQSMPALNVIDPQRAGPNWGQNVGQDIAQGSEALGAGIGAVVSPQAQLARATLRTQVASANAANQLATQKSLDQLSLHQKSLDTESAALDAAAAKNNLQKLLDQGASQSDVVDAQIKAQKADNKARAAAADFQTSQIQQTAAQQQQIARLMQQNPGMTSQTAINLVVHGNPQGMSPAPAAAITQGPLSGATPLTGTPTSEAPTPPPAPSGPLSTMGPLSTGTSPLSGATPILASTSLSGATLTPSTATGTAAPLASATPVGNQNYYAALGQQLGLPPGVMPTPQQVQDAPAALLARAKAMADLNLVGAQAGYYQGRGQYYAGGGTAGIKNTPKAQTMAVLTSLKIPVTSVIDEDAKMDDIRSGQYSGDDTDYIDPAKLKDAIATANSAKPSAASAARSDKENLTLIQGAVKAGVDPSKFFGKDGNLDTKGIESATAEAMKAQIEAKGTGSLPAALTGALQQAGFGGNSTAGTAPGQLTPAQTAAVLTGL